MTDSIAGTALQYRGKVPYVFGRANPHGWDCSGMVNYVLGHDLKMTLPGGVKNFTGSWHGPVVVQYATWGGAAKVSGPPQPGDLCIWPGVGAGGHIGIATGPETMISALNPQYGTAETPIQGYGPAGVPVVFHRVSGSGTASGCVVPLVMIGGLAWIAKRYVR